MSAILRLAVSGLRGRNRAAALATALVAALATTGVVAGLSVQSQGGPQVDRIYVEDGQPDLVIEGDPDVLEALRGDAAFAGTGPVTPHINTSVAMGDGSVDARIDALSPGSTSESTVGRPLLRTGRWPAPGVTGEVVFDQAAANEAGIRTGDTVQVTVQGQQKSLTVVGTAIDLTDCFYPDCDPIRLFVDGAELEALAPDPADRGTLVIARLKDPGQADAVAARLVGHEGVEGTQTWADTRDDILLRDVIFGAALAAFGLFVLIAAAFVVAGTASARLLARRREIALLQSVGYTGRQIITGLVGETLLLGAAGVLAGWVVGTLLAPVLQVGLGGPFGRTGFRVDPLALGASAAIVGVILTLATALPARRAGPGSAPYSPGRHARR